MKKTAVRIAAALALAFAIGHAQTARADYWDWVGKGSGQTSYFDEHGNAQGTTGSWYHSVKTTSDKFAQDNHNFANANSGGRPAFNSGWDYNVTFRYVTSMTGAINIEYSTGKEITFVATAADKGVNSSASLSLIKGAVKIESGTYTFSTIPITGGSTLTMNGGTLTPGYFQLGNGNAGTLTMNGGTLKTKSSYPRIGAGSNGTGVFTVKTGAVFDTSESSNKNMTLGQDSGATGTLNVEGGDVTVAGYIAINYNSGSKNSVVNITDGGTLNVGEIKFRPNGGSGAGTITIDNGTIKALNDHANFIPAHNDLTFAVGPGGGTIDNDGHNITIGAALGGTGAMTFKGNGTTTLSGTPSYTGGTTNVAGNVLSLTAAAKAALVAYPIAVEIPPTGAADGRTVFEINDGNGTFTQAEVDAMVVTGTDASRYALSLADGGTKVVVSDTLAGEYVWNDGASGAGWRTSGKWSKNGVAGDWYDSTVAVFENAGDAATVDSPVTAASVEFRADATVSGSAALTVPSVTVASGVSAAISAPVAGPLEKSGAGTLTLSQSRADQTQIAEGTLVMTGNGTTIDWVDGMLGTVAGKTVALKFENGATLASSPWNISLGHDTSGSVGEGVTVELHKDGDDWIVRNRFTIGWNSGDAGKFYHDNGTMTVAEQFRISSQAGSSGEFTMNGGNVTVSNNLYVGCNINAVKGVFNMNGGSFTCLGTTYVPFSKNDYPAELHINGGTFKSVGTFIAGNGADSEAVIELSSTDGTPGVLETKGLTLGSGSATLTFNGGELKAAGDLEAGGLVAGGIAVRVGANGGVLNANGKAVAMPGAIGAAGDTGGMTYKGGGSVILAVQPAYSGVTTVEVGTTLSVPSPIAGADLAFAIPGGLASGLYKVVAVSGDGAFASDVLSAAALPSGVSAHFYLDNDNKEIWCIYSSNASDHIWIGGSAGSLNDGANWLSGSVPSSGTAIIGNASAATLTNPEGSAFAATTIIVPSGSAAVTISGAKFSGMSKITNNSSSMVEFENAVEFSGNVDVLQNTGIVKFTGGATGTWLARAMDLHGTYTFTGSGDRTEHGGTVVKSDGVYKLPNATFYKHNGDFHIEAGGRAEVKDAKISSKDGDKKLLGTFNGEFKVNGEFHVTAPESKGVTHYTCNSGSGTLIANKIRVAQSGYLVTPSKTIIGTNGIIRGAGYVRVYNSGSHEFGSYADWTMYYDHYNNTATEYFVIYKHSSSGSWSDVTFDTTDYYDKTTGRTITSEAPIGAADAASAAKFRVTVKGKGRFVFANTSDYNIFSGGLTVNDSATIEAKANAWPGKGAVTLNGTSTLLMHTGGAARTGAITLNSGTTLEVAETSGTASLGGALTMNQGSKLKFKLAGNGNARLALTDLTLNATAENKALVEFASGSVKSYGGSYTLTSGGKFSEGDEAKFALPEGDGGKLAIEGGNLVYTAPEVYFHIKIAEGSSSDLEVPLSWVCDNTAVDGASSAAEIETALKNTGANGIPVWQSYCLGLNPKEAASVVLCDSAETQPSDGTVKIAAKNLNVPEGLSGVTVKARLYRKNGGEWEAVGDYVTVSSGTAELASPTLGDGMSFFQIRVVLDPV